MTKQLLDVGIVTGIAFVPLYMQMLQHVSKPFNDYRIIHLCI